MHASTSVSAPASFGLWLSLLAIGLTLNVISGVTGWIVMPPDSTLEDRIEIYINLGVSAACLVALTMLLQRRRAFVPLMTGLLAFNILSAFALAGYFLAIGVPLETGRLVALLALQTAISGLWIAYLLKSERVREVCVN